MSKVQWKAWGFAAERYELSRADLLEDLVKQNQGHFPDIYPQKPILKTNITLNQDELNQKVNQVLAELQLGKQAPKYKLVQKNLNRLIELILLSSK